MLLAPVEGIRAQLGFDNMTDINLALLGAMQAAGSVLSGKLSTDFNRGEVTDTFFLEDVGYAMGGEFITKLRLSNGFVSALTGANLSSAAERALTRGRNAFSVDSLSLDKEKGIVTERSTRFTNQTITVTYTKGFEVETNEDGALVYQGVPDWLQQAAIMQTLVLMDGHSVLTDANVRPNTKANETQLNWMIRPHLRYAPDAIAPE